MMRKVSQILLLKICYRIPVLTNPPLVQKVDCIRLPVADLAFNSEKLGHGLVGRTTTALRLAGLFGEMSGGAGPLGQVETRDQQRDYRKSFS